jgi:hypothetical protein
VARLPPEPISASPNGKRSPAPPTLPRPIPAQPKGSSDLYTQAAGPPNFGITAFELNTGAFEVPEGNVKDIRVELPEGLGVNPEATEQCTVAELPNAASECPGALIGTDYIRASVESGPPPACPRASALGRVDAEVGAGPKPLHVGQSGIPGQRLPAAALSAALLRPRLRRPPALAAGGEPPLSGDPNTNCPTCCATPKTSACASALPTSTCGRRTAAG